MPMYDFECATCGEVHESLQPIGTKAIGSPCHPGQLADKVWGGRCPSMIPDTYVGGLMIENLGPRPIRVESRSHHKDLMRAKGVRPGVEHRGVPGSDKSPHTTRWI